MPRSLLCLLLACAPKSVPTGSAPLAEPPPSGADVVPAGEPITPVQLHMSERFEKATLARDALIRGHLDESRAALAWMSSEPLDPGVPQQWSGHLDAMQAAAARGAASDDPDAVAQAVAGMANVCGSCHRTVEVSPSLPAMAPPSDDGDLAGHMDRHLWAVDRMWVSLVLGSEQAWREAVDVLDDSPLATSEFDGATLSPTAQAHATAVHDEARAALDDDNPDTRSDLYGQIVAACAGCHVELGVGE